MKASVCSRALAALVALFVVLSAYPLVFAEAENGQPISEEAVNSVKAYPGAEGFGAVSKGGRGGEVYHVTNLNPGGEGSLTYGIENESGARTIVFDVGGVIDLTELGRALELKGENGSNITIAGQTAPYPGITIKGYGFDIEKAHDIIIRNLRVRIGGVRADGELYSADPLLVKASKRVIVDHCSMQWGIDKGFVITGEDITLSNNIFDKQLLANSPHDKGGHAYVGMVNEGARRISIAKNLIGDSTQRSPRITDSDYVDVYNNMLYNCGNGIDVLNYEFLNKNISVNVYNNYARTGPSLSNSVPYRAGRGREYSGGVAVYFAGNVKDGKAVNGFNSVMSIKESKLHFGTDNDRPGTEFDQSNITLDEWMNNPVSYDNNNSASAATLTYMNYPFAAPRAEIIDTAAEGGTDNLIDYTSDKYRGAGATKPGRDLYDTMVMKEMQLGGTYRKALTPTLDQNVVTPFFEKLEARTGLDYSAYKTARTWTAKQGDGPVLKGAESTVGKTKPVRWDDYTDVNTLTNASASDKYKAEYTTNFDIGDWWGEYCGAPGQADGKYIAVGRTAADLYPEKWILNDYPEAAAAMERYRTDNYGGQADSTPIIWDTAGDGIPDWYKQYRGLEINTDYSKTVNNETGYTYLEEYLAFMAGDKETELPPVSIENFKANNISYSAVQAFWNTDGRAKCTIEYGTEPGKYTESKTLTYDGVSGEFDTYHKVVLNKLSADTQYYYKVTAVDENGIVSTAEYDANDEVKKAMTFKTSPAPEGDLLPSKPVITGFTPYTGQVEVRWSGNVDDEGYEIYYDTEDHGFDYTEYPNKIENIGAREKSYTVTGLTDSTRYYFVVAAVNMHGRSSSASATAVPERRFMHYDFSQMSDAELSEFMKNTLYYSLGGTVSVQKDPDTGKNVLQLLDETNSHRVYLDFKLPLVQNSKFTYEIKVKNLYQKQTDALNKQNKILFDALNEKSRLQFDFLEDLLAGSGVNSKASDLYSDAFNMNFWSTSQPISEVDGRFDGTTETGEICVNDSTEPIGIYSPGRTQGSAFEGEKVLPEGKKYNESIYKNTTVYGDACYSNYAETNHMLHSVWYYEKGSAEYVTYRAVVDPESGTAKIYADGELLYNGKVGDFDNVGKIRIMSRNDGFLWANIESISVYTGEEELNIPDIQEVPLSSGEIIVGDTRGLAGDEVVLPVKIENNPGMTSFNVEMSYDNTKLIPTEIVQSSNLPGEIKSEIRVPGYVSAKWTLDQRTTGYENNGDLFNVKFRIADSVAEGEIIPVTFSEVRVKDSTSSLIGLGEVGGGVSAAEPTWSIDSYEDGKVVLTAPRDVSAEEEPKIYIAKCVDYGDGEILCDYEILDIPVGDGKTLYEIQTEKGLMFSNTYECVWLMIWNKNMQPLCESMVKADYAGNVNNEYGFIADAALNTITFAPSFISLNIVREDGAADGYDFADAVTFYNANDVIKEAVNSTDETVVYKCGDMSDQVNRKVMESLVGKEVKFTAEKREIKNITLMENNNK